VQLDVNLVPANVVSCVYTGTEFWVGRYTTDTMYTLNNAGVVTSTFRVTGVGASNNGIRGLTYDGTHIFATVGTNKVIYKIDPVTKTLVSSVTATAVAFNLRGIAFDSTANGGLGGFWVSTFNSDFVQVSRTGAVLNTIPVASHTLTGVYGIAYDPYTSGGPYLWAHDQGAGTESRLKQVSIVTGAPTGLMHDITLDVAPGTIAGSVSITWRFMPGEWTIMGVGQAAPSQLFAYELSDFVMPSLDASADSIDFNPPYTIIPEFEVVPYNWTVKATNNGSTTITDLSTTFTITDGATDFFAPPVQTSNNVASLQSVYSNFGPFTPALGTYYMQAVVSTGSQIDVVSYNDTTIVPLLSVGDSVYAREDGQAVGSLGIGDGTGGTLGQFFTLAQPGYISSATFRLNGPTAGNVTNVDLYSFAGTPQTILANSASYTITAADTDGVVLTLPFLGGLYYAAAGDYFLGVNETTNNITLSTTAFNYRPNSTFVTFTGNPWAASETFGFPITYLLRLNVIDPSTVSIAEIANQQYSVYPNPASSELHFNSQSKDYKVEIFDAVGNLVLSNNHVTEIDYKMNVSSLAAGMYTARISSGSNSSTMKISIVR
jgi:hypothetical protein